MLLIKITGLRDGVKVVRMTEAASTDVLELSMRNASMTMTL
jgi:hypothetical protein